MLTSNDTKALEKQLEYLGYGFIDLLGQWQDDTGKVWRERSYFIPNMPLEEGLRLGLEHNQIAIIYGEHVKWYLYDVATRRITARGITFDVLNTYEDKASDYSVVPKQPERGFAFAASKRLKASITNLDDATQQQIKDALTKAGFKVDGFGNNLLGDTVVYVRCVDYMAREVTLGIIQDKIAALNIGW